MFKGGFGTSLTQELLYSFMDAGDTTFGSFYSNPVPFLNQRDQVTITMVAGGNVPQSDCQASLLCAIALRLVVSIA